MPDDVISLKLSRPLGINGAEGRWGMLAGKADPPRGRPADPCPQVVPLVRVHGGRGPAVVAVACCAARG